MHEERAPDLIDRLAHGARAYGLIAALALLAALAGVFTLPPLDRDEGRYAQATAQMLESGDVVRIRYLDEARNKKPAGIHWLQAASVATVSSVEAREIWAYRLPSVLAAALTAVATFWGGIAMVGRRAAFVGAALLSVSVLLASEGMIAKTDAALAASCAVALAALARLRLRPPGASGRGEAVILWAAIAAGVLIKGPVAPMSAGLAVLALAVWERRVAWLTPMAWWPGPLLAAAIAAPWWIAIGVVTEGQFYVDALLGDVGDKVSGGGEHPVRPPGLHTLLMPVLIFPATIALPGAALWAWRTLRAPARSEAFAPMRVLVAWALPTLLAFELAPTKLVHYTLPIFPAVALLAGAALTRPLPAWARIAGLALFALAGLAYLVIAGAVVREAGGPQAPALALGGVLAAVSLALIATTRMHGRLAALLLAGLAVSWCVRGALLPGADALAVSRAADAALTRSGLVGEGPIALIGYSEPSLVFLLSGDVALYPGPRGAEAVQAGDVALVEAAAQASFTAGLAARGLRMAPVGPPVTGLHYNNGGRPLSLQPARIVESP